MSFTTDIEQINTKLGELLASEQTNVTTDTYNNNISKLENINEEFQKILKDKNLFNSNNLSTNYNTEKLAKMRANLEKVSENFQNVQTAESLTQGRYLGQYLSISEEFIQESKSENKNSWKNFCRTKYNKESFNELEQRIIETPKNKENLEKFEQKYIIFLELISKNDLSEDDFSSLEKCSKSLNEIRSNFKEDYHRDVEIFLNELNKKDFVTIEFLTEEVKKFINENKFENIYVIKRNNQ